MDPSNARAFIRCITARKGMQSATEDAVDQILDCSGFKGPRPSRAECGTLSGLTPPQQPEEHLGQAVLWSGRQAAEMSWSRSGSFEENSMVSTWELAKSPAPTTEARVLTRMD